MFAEAGKILFVDDDPALRAANVQSLELANLSVESFDSARAALGRIESGFNGVIVSDIRMPEMDGLAFFDAVREIDPAIPFILITGHGDVQMAVDALQAGAHDFLTKPFAADHLIASVRRGLTHRSLELDNQRLRRLAEESEQAGSPLLGETPVMIRLRETIAQVAEAKIDVLIEGEAGVGKELVAHLLHRGSQRSGRPFVDVNCGALPDTLAERQLFGEESYDRRTAQTGKIEAAHRGTLFLDEIENLSPAVQVRLLRALEDQEVVPVGAKEPRPIDVRVIASTKRDLQAAVAEGSFREDLLYRINIVRLRIPPLRERRADVPLLFASFVAEAAQRMGRTPPPLSDDVRTQLLEHDWPGNIRELRNFAFRSILGLDEGGAAADVVPTDRTLPERVERFEASVIESVLTECRGDVQSALARLGIPRKTFYDKLSRHGIDIRAFRS